MRRVYVCYGIEMTPTQELKFTEYRMKHGIAMNTYCPEGRKKIAEEWLRENAKHLKG